MAPQKSQALEALGLQVLVLPFQASGTGPGEEPDPAFPVDDLPLLSGVVEFDGDVHGYGCAWCCGGRGRLIKTI